MGDHQQSRDAFVGIEEQWRFIVVIGQQPQLLVFGPFFQRVVEQAERLEAVVSAPQFFIVRVEFVRLTQFRKFAIGQL